MRDFRADLGSITCDYRLEFDRDVGCTTVNGARPEEVYIFNQINPNSNRFWAGPIGKFQGLFELSNTWKSVVSRSI